MNVFIIFSFTQLTSHSGRGDREGGEGVNGNDNEFCSFDVTSLLNRPPYNPKRIHHDTILFPLRHHLSPFLLILFFRSIR